MFNMQHNALNLIFCTGPEGLNDTWHFEKVNAGDYMRSIHEKAKMMFDKKAYLHWYQKYNCEETVFREAFEEVHCIAQLGLDSIQ